MPIHYTTNFELRRQVWHICKYYFNNYILYYQGNTTLYSDSTYSTITNAFKNTI